MTTSTVDSIARSIEKTNIWINELKNRLGWADDHAVYEALRVSLIAIRDRISLDEAAHLSAQLPLILRGAFYDQFVPSRPVSRAQTIDDVLAPVRDHFSNDPTVNAETVFRAVLDVMAVHVSPGELHDVRSQMPKAIQEIWPVK